MKSQQDPPEMLKKMAHSMNLSVPEFGEKMLEEHGLVPPDDSDDYYVPPKRVMSINAMPPEAARRRADELRQALREPELSRYKSEELANDISQCVSAYGEVDERLEELGTPKKYDSAAHSEAARLEYNALIMVRQDKEMTTHQADSLNSVATTLGLMNKGTLIDRPVDLLAFKEGIEKQMDELIALGTARERRVAQFVIMAQQAAEKLMIQAAFAPTAESMAMVMEKATKIMGTTTKMLKELDEMATPKTGRLVEHIPDKQIAQSPKKMSEQTTGRA